jgi:hypothetical protein
MWYIPTTDTRGRVLVDFLSQHGLLTANEKDGPTYSGPTGESWIYITVTTVNSALKIQNWRIGEESTHSDHNLILFNLRILSNNTKSNRVVSNSTRNFATQLGNWNRYTLQVQQNNQQWTDLVNSTRRKDQLDKSITVIWSKLGEIYKKCFPQFLPKTKYAPWLYPELNTLRKQVKALKRKVKRCKNLDLKRSLIHASRPSKTYINQNFLKLSKTPGRNSVQRVPRSHRVKCTKLAKLASSLTLQDGSITTS